MAGEYGIEIVTEKPEFPVATIHGLIQGQEAESRALARYVELFIQEFSLYPPILVRRAHVLRVVLCEELSFADQRRGAVPDFQRNTFYVDVSRGSYDQDYMRRVIHHEFFHFIDFYDDGYLYLDKSWASLNDPKAMYGTGGVGAQSDSSTSLLTDKFAGFLTRYSTTGVEEDKAEVFACLLTESEYVSRRIEVDPVVRAKAARMKQLVGEFAPEADEAFWQRAAESR